MKPSISIALAACLVVVGAGPAFAASARKSGATTTKAAKACNSRAKDAKCKPAPKPKSDTAAQTAAPLAQKSHAPEPGSSDQSGAGAAS